MTIEITNEMLAATGRVKAPHNLANRAIVKAIIEIIERDYIVHPHCLDALSSDIRCTLSAGHSGDHRFQLANGNPVTWSEM